MLKNTGVKNGIILGIVSIIFSHVCYMINPKWLLTGIAYASFIILIYFMYRSAIEERTKNEGLLSFGEALKSTFLTYVIGTLFGSIYIYLMFNVIDPSLGEVLREVQMEQAEFFANLLGAEDQIDGLPEVIEQQNIQFNFYMVLMQYLVGLIFPGFVLALVISAITKKEPVS
jgi:hypothetical protein